MDMVFRNGQMARNMKANGKIIKLLAKVNSSILMETYVKILRNKNNFREIDDGEWKSDKANGYGVYLHVNGSKYEGYWKDD